MAQRLLKGTVHKHKVQNAEMVITKERGEVMEDIFITNEKGKREHSEEVAPDLVEARFESYGKYITDKFYYYEFQHIDVDVDVDEVIDNIK